MRAPRDARTLNSSARSVLRQCFLHCRQVRLQITENCQSEGFKSTSEDIPVARRRRRHSPKRRFTISEHS